MATNNKGRISDKATEFAPYMQTTDDLQLNIDTLTGNPRWQTWGWTLAQSEQWTEFRKQSDDLSPQYADKAHNNTDTTDQMNLLIAAVKKYDNDPLTGNHLLNRVALNGTISDCETFHVKRGTALERVSRQGNPAQRSIGALVAGDEKPVLKIKKYDVAEHLISVGNAATPKRAALPDGIKFAKVYRYIGTTEPTTLAQYTFVGNAHRGTVLSSFTDADLAAFPVDKIVYAWYVARYESTKGVLGNACGSIRAEILKP